MNPQTRRHSCLFCGEGIGDTPTPVRTTPLRRQVEGRYRGLDMACGTLLGMFGGAVAMLAIPWDLPITEELALFMMACPALVLALAGSLFGDRFWDWLSDALESRGATRPRAP